MKRIQLGMLACVAVLTWTLPASAAEQGPKDPRERIGKHAPLVGQMFGVGGAEEHVAREAAADLDLTGLSDGEVIELLNDAKTSKDFKLIHANLTERLERSKVQSIAQAQAELGAPSVPHEAAGGRRATEPSRSSSGRRATESSSDVVAIGKAIGKFGVAVGRRNQLEAAIGKAAKKIVELGTTAPASSLFSGNLRLAVSRAFETKAAASTPHENKDTLSARVRALQPTRSKHHRAFFNKHPRKALTRHGN